MIQEDQQIMALNKQKQDQAKMDMVMSVTEKRDMLKRQKEQEEYENQQLKQYAQQQQLREDEIRAKKAEADAAKETIFQQLKEQEQ